MWLKFHVRASAKKVGIVQQLGDAQEGKFASQQFADSGLRYIKKLFELAGREFLLFDQLEDVLMQIGLQLKLQTVLFAHIKLIEDASLCPVSDQLGVFLSHVAVHGAV